MGISIIGAYRYAKRELLGDHERIKQTLAKKTLDNDKKAERLAAIPVEALRAYHDNNKTLVKILKSDQDILEKLNEKFKSYEWPELNYAIKTIESQDGRCNELMNLKSFVIMNPHPSFCGCYQYNTIFYNPSDSSLPSRFSADEIRSLDMKFYNSESWKKNREIDNPLLHKVNDINYVHKLIKDGAYTKKEIEDRIALANVQHSF